MNSQSSFERETMNNQKRIIRELKRIADALEKIERPVPCGCSFDTTAETNVEIEEEENEHE